MTYLVSKSIGVADVLHEVFTQGIHGLPLDHHCLKHGRRRQGTRHLALKRGDLQSPETGWVLHVLAINQTSTPYVCVA